MKKENIDTVFAKGLKDLAPMPNPGLWAAITHKMVAKKRRKKRLIIFFTSGVAAVILLLLAVSISQLWRNTNHIPQSTVVHHIKDSTSERSLKRENSFTKNQDKREIDDNLFNPEKKILKKMIAKKDYTSKQKSQKRILTKDKNANTKKTALLVRKKLNSKIQIQQSFKRIAPMEKRTALSANLEEDKKFPDILQFKNDQSLEQQLIAYNRNLQQTVETTSKQKWAIIGQIATAYSSEKSSNKSGIVNIGGGIKVNLKMGKRFALQTGISFNRYGQSYGETKQYNFRDAIHEDAFFSSNNTSLPTATPAGKIARGSGLEKNVAPQLEFSKYNIFKGVPENIEQHFDYIELPLLLRYNITEKRIGVFVMGGFGINYLIDNGVYTINNHQKIGEIDNLRKTNVTSQLGIGIEYRLSNKLKIGIEPTIKYHINSLNSKEEYNYKPYSIGLQTGISIDF